MEEIFCDISAFRIHRTPPQVLMLCPRFPLAQADPKRRIFKNHVVSKEIAGLPIHLLATSRRSRIANTCAVSHLATHELPFGCIQDTDLGIRLTSPLYTLFQLAHHMQEDQLLLAMYEFCGTFSVFKPTPVVEQLLDDIENDISLPRDFGWTRVVNQRGQKTDLWKRAPLVDIAELQRFACDMKSERGGRRFERAARRVTGITASPFEVQASILFSTPRDKGGEGFPRFVNNEEIPLSREARRIFGKTRCYADLLFETPNDLNALIVECQGKMVHDNWQSNLSDSNRTVALQQMGFSVMPLTYKQIADRHNFDAVRKVVAKQLGIRYKRKSETAIQKEIDLRRNIFIDWSTLGQ